MTDQERIAYLRLIIKTHPNTPKARNARLIIRDIKEGMKS